MPGSVPSGGLLQQTGQAFLPMALTFHREHDQVNEDEAKESSRKGEWFCKGAEAGNVMGCLKEKQ